MLSVSNPHDVHLKPSPLPGWLQWVFIALFGLGVVASGVMSLMEHWRRATFLLGAAMIWLAVGIFYCPRRSACVALSLGGCPRKLMLTGCALPEARILLDDVFVA